MVRWIGIGVGSLVGAVRSARGVVYLLTQRRVDRHHEIAGHEVAIGTGVRPDGVPLGKDMPVELFSHLTDDEVTALWNYLRTVPAKAYGSR